MAASTTLRRDARNRPIPSTAVAADELADSVLQGAFCLRKSQILQALSWASLSANSGGIRLRRHRSVADVRALAGRPLPAALPGAMRRPAAPGHHLPAGLERGAPRARLSSGARPTVRIRQQS